MAPLAVGPGDGEREQQWAEEDDQPRERGEKEQGDEPASTHEVPRKSRSTSSGSEGSEAICGAAASAALARRKTVCTVTGRGCHARRSATRALKIPASSSSKE